MDIIETEELKGMLDSGTDLKLVFCLGEGEFSLKHIPGSICVDSPANIDSSVGHEDNIVVYCSGPDCLASALACELLVKGGYKHVRRFSGGIYAWEIAGPALEGELVS